AVRPADRGRAVGHEHRRHDTRASRDAERWESGGVRPKRNRAMGVRYVRQSRRVLRRAERWESGDLPGGRTSDLDPLPLTCAPLASRSSRRRRASMKDGWWEAGTDYYLHNLTLQEGSHH